MNQIRQEKPAKPAAPLGENAGTNSNVEAPLTEAQVQQSLWRAFAALAPGGTGLVYLPPLEPDSSEKK